MSVKHAQAAAAVVVAGCAAFLVPGAGTAAAAKSAPEITVELVGNTNIRWSWDTHGREGCTAFIGAGADQTKFKKIKPKVTSGVSTPRTVKPAYVVCPDGTESKTIRVYGPRDPINDLRTQFNLISGDSFGS